MLIPHGALVLVLDGAHVRLLRNRGRETGPDLEPVPGDRLRRCGTRADRHDDRARVREVIEAVDPLLAAGTPLILVAPPDLLGAMRSQLPPQARRHVIAEIGRDLARCAPHELAERLHRTPA